MIIEEIQHTNLELFFSLAGVPTVVQRVKNPTAAARVTVEVQVQFSAWHSGLEDLALLQVCFGFNSWPGNFHMQQVQP